MPEPLPPTDACSPLTILCTSLSLLEVDGRDASTHTGGVPLTASGGLMDCLALSSGKSEIRSCAGAALDPSARRGAEYLDLVVSRCGLDFLHIGRFLWWKGS